LEELKPPAAMVIKVGGGAVTQPANLLKEVRRKWKN